MKRYVIPDIINPGRWMYLNEKLLVSNKPGEFLFSTKYCKGNEFGIYSIGQEVKKIFSNDNVDQIKSENSGCTNYQIISFSNEFYLRALTRENREYCETMFFDIYTNKLISEFKGKYLICDGRDCHICRVGNTGIITGYRINSRDDEEYNGSIYIDLFLKQEKEIIGLNDIVVIKCYEGRGINLKVIQVGEFGSEVMQVVVSPDELMAAALIINQNNIEICVIDLE